jgi:hypothetical protein
MAIARSKSIIPLLLRIASFLFVVSCSSVIVQTPQEMSDHVISMVNVDPQTDPNPQSLASDQVGCANKARREYPIGGVNEQAIMTGSIVGGALGGAASGAAGSAGSGHAGVGAAVGALGGVGQGGLNGMAEVKKLYVIQTYQQGTHYALCLVQQGHVIYGPSKQDLECARVQLGCPRY